MQSKPSQESVATAPTISGSWDIQYEYSTGPVAARFFEALRKDGRLLATKCAHCHRTMLPPRGYCETCFKPADEWVEVGPSGVVVTFTVSYRRFGGMQRNPPFVLAMIRLDGADTNIIHIVDGLDVQDPDGILRLVKEGLRVDAVFLPPEERTGTILDIQSFSVRS